MIYDIPTAQFFHEYSVDLINRVVYIGSASEHEGCEMGVDYKLAERTIKNLFILDNSKAEPITIILNNPGGDTCHGFAIYDAIKGCQNYVRIYGMGHVMSMASVLMQAGDERIMSPNSKMMLHYGSLAIDGGVKDVINWVEAERKEMSLLENIYLEKIRAKNPKFSKAALQSKIRHDCILSPVEAQALGLIDRVGGSSNGWGD